jgi:hypothetical protein
MSPDQALEIIAKYAFEFFRGNKAFKKFWKRFLPFVDNRIEGFAKLSITTIDLLVNTMAVKEFHKQNTIWSALN